MKLSIKIWKFTITLKVLDMDTSDRNVSVAIILSW